MSVKVAMYARSSINALGMMSSEDQLRICRNYMSRQSDWIEAHVFTDDGVSGSSAINHLGHQNLLTAVNDRKIDLVLAEDLSRFSRSKDDVTSFLELCEARKIKVYTVANGLVKSIQDCSVELIN